MSANDSTARTSKGMVWTGRILSAVVVLMLAMSATMKLVKPPSVTEGFTHLGWPEQYALRLGVVELLCAIVYALPRTSVLGAVLVTGYLGGAVATHARIGEPQLVGAVVFGVVTWLGLFFRDARIRALVPFKTP